jgi:anti-sigma factor RsiW
VSHLGQRISALIDGELTDAERDRVLTHLAGCDECRQEAVALRALKRRMHSLGEAMVDAALTGRLMAMATPGEPGHAPWRPRPAFPGARLLTAGLLASAMTGLGATAFFVGGEPQAPGPKVTPAVDTFLVQHAIVTGDVPVAPVTGGAPARAAAASPARRAADHAASQSSHSAASHRSAAARPAASGVSPTPVATARAGVAPAATSGP